MKKLLLFILSHIFFQFSFAQCVSEQLLENEFSTINSLKSEHQTSVYIKLLSCPFTDSSKAKISKRAALSYYSIEKDNKKAIKYIQSEIYHWAKYKNKFSNKLADAYYNLGYFFNIDYQYDNAIRNYKVVPNLTDDKSFKAICYKEIAEICIYKGDYLQTEIFAKRGISELENTNLDNFTLATCFNALGISNEFQGKYSDAIINYRTAKKIIYKKNLSKNEQYLLANIEYNIGKVYGLQKKTVLASKQYKISRDLFSNTDTLKMILLPNLALANLFDYDRKDYKTASSILDESINIIKNKYRHVKSPQISRLYSNASIIYINNKEFKKAETCTFDALKAFPNATKSIHDINLKVLRRISDKWTFYDLLRSYSSWYLLEKYKITKEKKYLKEALTVFEKLDLLIDLMRAEHLGFENLSKFHWRERTHRLFESAIETCFLLKDYQKAFYFFEKSRAVMLNDKINELGAKQTLSEDDQQQERKYIKDISELNANIEKEQNQKKKSDLTTQLYTLQEQQDRFIKTLETKNPAYYQLKYDTTTFQLNDIQSYLKKTQINSLVEYFMGDSTTYAIVVTPENVTLKKLSLKPENIQQFLEYCSKNISTKTELSALLGYGSSLYQSLIAPLNLPNGRLIISQDGAFIPFEAISKSSNSPQYLLKDYAISYTYSAQFLMKNQEKYGFLPNKIFLGAAPINFSSKLNTLQGSEQSLKNIEKNYTFGNLLTNQVASRNAFLNEAGKYKIVQLYTHAFADSNDTEPKIYFADSALKVSDLNLTDHFKTNLLVLSACKTGVGKVAKGEGVLSLARGFSMAGIRSTITSLWSVEDKDTYTLTELFHHYLNEGLPKDEALQQAKLEFIERNENTTPYSWAGFILIGDSSEISTSNWIIWALAVFLITSMALIFAKKLSSNK